MKTQVLKRKRIKLRRGRVRAKIVGNKERPRISVFRSNNHIYVQIIDDEAAKTLLAANDIKLEKGGSKNKTNKTEIAFKLGKMVGEEAKKSGITSVVFDRGGRKYHGRVKAVAEGLRDAGIKI